MALPKSMQALGGVSLLMFIYLLTLIFRSPSTATVPGDGGKIDDMSHDPNLDRKSLKLRQASLNIH
jgi:hypothetical protein